MRHNLRVSPATRRPRPRRRPSGLFGLLTAFLALVSLIGVMAPVAQAAAPTITKPADQTSTAGTAIKPVTVTGTEIQNLKASGLPKGLTLVDENATEATISGTPTNAETVEVTLEAENESEKATAKFKWTVEPEAVAVIN